MRPQRISLSCSGNNLKLHNDSKCDAEAAAVTGENTTKSLAYTSLDTQNDSYMANQAEYPSIQSQDYAKSMLRLEVATYIEQMTVELSTMARNSDMPLLSYFLDMASAEARAMDEKLREVLKLGSEPDTVSAIAQA
jgi:hypothetical protein